LRRALRADSQVAAGVRRELATSLELTSWKVRTETLWGRGERGGGGGGAGGEGEGAGEGEEQAAEEEEEEGQLLGSHYGDEGDEDGKTGGRQGDRWPQRLAVIVFHDASFREPPRPSYPSLA